MRKKKGREAVLSATVAEKKTAVAEVSAEPHEAPKRPRRTKRRAQRHRQETASILVIGVLAFVGTLAITLVTAHASVTGGGYQRTDLRQEARRLDEENQRLRAKIAYLESGARVAKEAPDHHLINDRKNIRILTATTVANSKGR